MAILCCPATIAAAQTSAPNFDYTPPPGAAPGSAGVSLAVVAPSWTTAADWTQSGPLADFTSALKGDFFELVTARGFTARGPFPNYQAMLFPDKQGTDLVLMPELDLKVNFDNLQKQKELLSGKIRFKGTAVVGGRVNLSLGESLSNERMWVKSIEIPGIDVKFQMKKWLDADLGPAEVRAAIWRDPAFTSAVGPVLDSIYNRILQTSWSYLEPAEVRQIKEQSLAVRQRKSY
jgi:hypothetical protein